MAIALTILKIIGIILLAIICLILFVAALILFVPIRYRAVVKKEHPDDGIFAKGAVTYLLHIISGGFVYNGEVDRYVKLFGFRIWPRKDKPYSGHEPADTTPEDTSAEDTEEHIDETVPAEEDYSIDWNREDEEDTVFSGDNDAVDDPFADEKDIFDLIDEIADRVAEKYDSLSQKCEDIKKKARYWDRMYQDCRNRAAIGLIWQQVVKLLKKIAPKKVKGFVHFGFEDPATTGKVLVYLSMIYPALPRRLVIEPSFSDTDVYGDLDIKGNLMLINVLVSFLKVFFNKDCKRLWRLYKKRPE